MRRKKLKLWMVENNLTIKEIAERLNVSRIHFSNIVNGKVNPSYEFMQKFKDEFHVENVFELFEKER